MASVTRRLRRHLDHVAVVRARQTCEARRASDMRDAEHVRQVLLAAVREHMNSGGR